MLSLSRCKLCQSKKIAVIKEYQATPDFDATWSQAFASALEGKQEVRIGLALCFSCGFLFYRDVLDDEELEALYAHEHRYSKVEISATKSGRLWELEGMKGFVARNTKDKTIQTVMDVGAGDFVALEKIVETLPEASFSAIDPSFEKDTFKGIRVFKTMLKNFVVASKYDLVMAVHVLEHVGDLHEFMSQLAGITKQYLYIEIPFQVSPGLFLNRSVSAQHINYFTVGTIRRLVESHGFVVEDCDFDTQGYIHNGMPGMIRLFARQEETRGSRRTALLTSLYYLINPWLFLKAKWSQVN